MIEKEIKIGKLTILGHKYEQNDNSDLKFLFDSWLSYKSAGEKFNQRAYLPEALTEGLVTKHLDNVYRKIKITKPSKGAITKFYCYDEHAKQIIEVKGCSIPNDLSSWSPKPYFNYFCLVDLSSLDGKYKIYKININSKEIMDVKVNESETFRDHATKAKSGGKRRPRFSIYETFIKPKKNCDGVPVFEGNLND